jgi:hypothetical protein
MESCANRSPLEFPANREKNREFFNFSRKFAREKHAITLDLRGFSHLRIHSVPRGAGN